MTLEVFTDLARDKYAEAHTIEPSNPDLIDFIHSSPLRFEKGCKVLQLGELSQGLCWEQVLPFPPFYLTSSTLLSLGN